MKTKLAVLLTVTLISASSVIFAQPININTAKEIAGNHLLTVGKGNLKSAGLNRVKYQFSSVTVATDIQDTLFYVLNDTINNGFVIVAADKRVWPILGYSSEGKYNNEHLPPAFTEWMQTWKQEIAYIKQKNLKPDAKTSKEWDNLGSSFSVSTEATANVGPLMQTTWNQGCYYNASCPFDAAGPCSHALTGCVATSMAQILKYWNYPTIGTGSHSYIHPVYGTLSANFGSTTYQWTQMTNNVTSQNNAVATLMYHCGVSLNMNYGPAASGAGLSTSALVDHFNYSSNVQYVNKSSYSASDWVNLIKNEIDLFRPVWYRGSDPDLGVGHAFVCDGYQDADFFHFNWGWGGSADGYFYLGSLNPGSYKFNTGQAAIIKIYPSGLPNGYIGFFLSDKYITTSGNGGVDSVRITSNVNWTVASDQSWLTVSPSTGVTGILSIFLTSSENNTGNTRSATVTVSATGFNSQTISVTQPPKVNVTPGGLATVLAGSLTSTINLTLTGSIDARDFKTMRDDMPMLSKIDLSGVNIVAYTGTGGTYSTASITYPANTIPERAFYNASSGISKTSLFSIKLPTSVTSVGNYAFNGCTGLSPITIPSSVTSIGTCAFRSCSGWFTVDAENPNYSGSEGILFNKTKTTLIQCPVSKTGNYTIPSSVTSVGNYSFYNCESLMTVTIPSSVASLGSYAFGYCFSLSLSAIPSSVTSIGSCAFIGVSGLISVEETNPNYSGFEGVLFNKTKTSLIQCPTIKAGKYIIPSTVNSIGFAAFYSCTGLTSIIIPSSVNSIANAAFFWCTGLTSVRIPSLVTSIGSQTFYYCIELKSVKIPSSVTSIGSSAFYYCTGLSSIYAYPASPVSLAASANVFSNVNKSTCILYVPYGSKSAYQSAVQWQDFTNITEIAFQSVNLTSGWNIFSSDVNPVDPDFLSLSQSLINDGSLIKIQDESGNTLEDYGVYGGWVNYIDNLSITEGYKVKVAANCQIDLGGFTPVLPKNIPLKSGWNIIGFPRSSEADGVVVVQHLIDAGTLVKVQDETGNTIEDWGVYGGWTNNIGNFKPGEGYKIKVNANDTLSINESYAKSGAIALQKADKPTHFQPMTIGNGVDHMNINLVEIVPGLLEEGDEIGVFDGDICVGAQKVQVERLKVNVSNSQKPESNSQQLMNLSIPISASDGTGGSGFTEGHPLKIRIWKAVSNREYLVIPEIINGSSTFKKHESSFASLEKVAVTGLNDKLHPGEMDVKIYPNPTDGKVYIFCSDNSLTVMNVQVINAIGQQILNQVLKANPAVIDLSDRVAGVYYFRIVSDKLIKTEMIILR